MIYQENFVHNSDILLEWCFDSKNVSWQREQFYLYGKQVLTPREVAWFGKKGTNYRYSGISHPGDSWPPQIEQLADAINTQFNLQTNFVLLNKYSSGEEYMGWHQDNETSVHAAIASVSLGAQRKFRYRELPQGPSKALDLANGSVLLFDGNIFHTLPKSKRVLMPRINLTFRQVNPITNRTKDTNFNAGHVS